MAETITGTFEPQARAGGHLRVADTNYRAHRDDVFISPEQQRKLHLRGGETVVCSARKGKRGKQVQLGEVQSINGRSVADFGELRPFEDLVAIDPDRPVRFETPGGPLSMRVVDLMTPIGFGQRGLIVAPPRTGKTVLLQQIAHGVAQNHPGMYMIMLLIDERPEEVTEMRRSVHGEVIYSSNDQDVASHVRIARLIIEKAKRHAECGEDVLVLLDSLTRVGRAFNAATRGRGRIMSGGLDVAALIEPKSIFGAARNIEHGGSLTIIATALIDTGSRMDEVIFNEFKGTGNMEIMLSRQLANMRVWPAIDLNASGTRKEERLLSPEALSVSHRLRRALLDKDPRQGMEMLLEKLGRFPTNEEFTRKFDQVSMR